VITIDGAIGEGGGQIVRTSVGLAALTGTPCRITNIRAKRRNSGLQEQHLQAVRAVAQLCQGTLEGDQLGSQTLSLIPGEIVSRTIEVKIGTAGSVGLLLQGLGIAAMRRGARIQVNGGGTFGKWAVPMSYVERVLLPLLWRFGYRADIAVERHGFYPRWGARLRVELYPWEPREKISLSERGALKRIHGLSIATQSLKQARVAERQAEAARQVLKKHFPEPLGIETHYCEAYGAGSALLLVAEVEGSWLGGDGLGERGKPAEKVGREAAENLVREWQSGAALDSHAADQILPFLAVSGGEVRVAAVTEHCRTNMHVIERFLPARFALDGNLIKVD
jgi:RNA 3'-terminal phosphate cyclase (GTP)